MRKSWLLGMLLSTRLLGQGCDPCTYPDALLCTEGKNAAKRSDWQETGFYSRRFIDEKYHYMSYIPGTLAADAGGSISWRRIWPYAQATLLLDEHADGTVDAKYFIQVPVQHADEFYKKTLKGILAQAQHKHDPLSFIGQEFKKLDEVRTLPVEESDQAQYRKDIDLLLSETCGVNY